jgi:hypothetical protein
MHRKTRAAFLAALFAGLALLPGLTATAGAAVTLSEAAGTWEAKIGALPAVTLTLEASGQSLKGSAIFYAIRDEGSGPEVVGKQELPLVDTRFHGETFTFGVEYKNRIIQFEVKFINENEAQIRRFTSEGAPLKLLRIPK